MPATRNVLGKGLVKTTENHTFATQRAKFESLHLHRSEVPGQGWGSNEERYDGFVKVVAEALISQTRHEGAFHLAVAPVDALRPSTSDS